MRALYAPLAVVAASVMAIPAVLMAQAALPKPFSIGDIFIDRNGDTLIEQGISPVRSQPAC